MSSASLKEEGNALFTKGEFQKASEKYTKAIELDCQNAVLYANRAACALNLKKYEDALQDAQKTIELDQKSTKGWARLATAQQALGNVPASIDSWEKALANIPEKMTPADERHKDRCKSALAVAAKAQNDFMRKSQSTHQVIATRRTGDNPWEVAQKMKPELERKRQPNSSAWIILAAYEEFSEALACLEKVREIPGPSGQKQYYGSPAGLAALCNSIMTDDRIFAITDPKFMDKYNKQVMFEIIQSKAWTNGTVEQVKTEAPQRLMQGGWAAILPAMSVTVRGYLMRGFFEAGFKGNHVEAARYKRIAVDILEWGDKVWPHATYQQKGSVFTRTYMRGARCMLLESYMQAFSQSPSPGKQQFSLEGLYELAEGILEDAETDDEDLSQYDPGFIQAYFAYPQGAAHSCLGIYHKFRGNYASTPDEAAKHYGLAAEHYAAAAEVYPPDEEKKLWFMNVGLEMLFKSGNPLRKTLPVIAEMRRMAPDMQRLWANSSLQRGGRDIALKKMWQFEDEVRTQIAAGKMSLDDAILPEEYK